LAGSPAGFEGDVARGGPLVRKRSELDRRLKKRTAIIFGGGNARRRQDEKKKETDQVLFNQESITLRADGLW